MKGAQVEQVAEEQAQPIGAHRRERVPEELVLELVAVLEPPDVERPHHGDEEQPRHAKVWGLAEEGHQQRPREEDQERWDATRHRSSPPSASPADAVPWPARSAGAIPKKPKNGYMNGHSSRGWCASRPTQSSPRTIRAEREEPEQDPSRPGRRHAVGLVVAHCPVTIAMSLYSGSGYTKSTRHAVAVVTIAATGPTGGAVVAIAVAVVPAVGLVAVRFVRLAEEPLQRNLHQVGQRQQRAEHQHRHETDLSGFERAHPQGTTCSRRHPLAAAPRSRAFRSETPRRSRAWCGQDRSTDSPRSCGHPP